MKVISNKNLVSIQNSWPAVSYTLNLLLSIIVHVFGILDYWTKRSFALKSVSIRLEAPLSFTRSSNSEYSAGARTVLDNYQTCSVKAIGIWLYSVLLLLFVAMLGVSPAVWHPTRLPVRATSISQPKTQLSFKHWTTSFAPPLFARLLFASEL